jgi:hypothetical protein
MTKWEEWPTTWKHNPTLFPRYVISGRNGFAEGHDHRGKAMFAVRRLRLGAPKLLTLWHLEKNIEGWRYSVVTRRIIGKGFVTFKEGGVVILDPNR